jgi:hypothetical protein
MKSVEGEIEAAASIQDSQDDDLLSAERERDRCADHRAGCFDFRARQRSVSSEKTSFASMRFSSPRATRSKTGTTDSRSQFSMAAFRASGD